MASSAAFYVIVALVVGGYVGWHARQARGIHADIKAYKSRLPAFRKVRNRSGLISLGVAAATLLLLRAMIR